jgi:hypothetical protein
VTECLLCGHAFSGVDFQQTSNEVERFPAGAAPFFKGEAVPTIPDGSMDVLVVYAVERRVATQQDIRDDTHRPHIARLVIFPSKDHWAMLDMGASRAACLRARPKSTIFTGEYASAVSNRMFSGFRSLWTTSW